MPFQGALDHLYEAERLLAMVKLPTDDRAGRMAIKNARALVQAAILKIDSTDKLKPT